MISLAAYLQTSNETQAAFAQRIDATQATVSRLCRHAMRPSLALATRIEAATGGAVPTNGWVEAEAAQP